MVTLTIIGIILLVLVLAAVTIAGGVLVIFIDPIIAVLIIWLCIKLIKWIKSKLSN